MTYTGHVQSGGIVLERKVDLPEGTAVRIAIMPIPSQEESLVDQLTGILPPDIDLEDARLKYILEKHK
ncbi:MAG: hypothetical protein HYV26_09600 [Candidatus Hydrogenedentes bacterium]|nr:hypothetical protein [Candidatus Hydrogenedentota bacterium]MBI3117653.1 hypothetical protein [Candidatus Hydrogenedentota bacterium]